MATSKLNKEQFANLDAFAGVMLVYNSTNKDGELVQTAQHFWGKDFRLGSFIKISVQPALNDSLEICFHIKSVVNVFFEIEQI